MQSKRLQVASAIGVCTVSVLSTGPGRVADAQSTLRGTFAPVVIGTFEDDFSSYDFNSRYPLEEILYGQQNPESLSAWTGGLVSPYQCVVAGFEGGCIADLDSNGVVQTADLAALNGSWGMCIDCPADLDGDGFVNATDLGILLSAWGPCDSDHGLTMAVVRDQLFNGTSPFTLPGNVLMSRIRTPTLYASWDFPESKEINERTPLTIQQDIFIEGFVDKATESLGDAWGTNVTFGATGRAPIAWMPMIIMGGYEHDVGTDLRDLALKMSPMDQKLKRFVFSSGLFDPNGDGNANDYTNLYYTPSKLIPLNEWFTLKTTIYFDEENHGPFYRVELRDSSTSGSFVEIFPGQDPGPIDPMTGLPDPPGTQFGAAIDVNDTPAPQQNRTLLDVFIADRIHWFSFREEDPSLIDSRPANWYVDNVEVSGREGFGLPSIDGPEYKDTLEVYPMFPDSNAPWVELLGFFRWTDTGFSSQFQIDPLYNTTCPPTENFQAIKVTYNPSEYSLGPISDFGATAGDFVGLASTALPNIELESFDLVRFSVDVQFLQGSFTTSRAFSLISTNNDTYPSGGALVGNRAGTPAARIIFGGQVPPNNGTLQNAYVAQLKDEWVPLPGTPSFIQYTLVPQPDESPYTNELATLNAIQGGTPAPIPHILQSNPDFDRRVFRLIFEFDGTKVKQPGDPIDLRIFFKPLPDGPGSTAINCLTAESATEYLVFSGQALQNSFNRFRIEGGANPAGSSEQSLVIDNICIEVIE